MPTEQPVSKCNKCGKKWVCSSAHAGKTAPCPACGTMMHIPQMPCQMPQEPVRPIVTAQRVYRRRRPWLTPENAGYIAGGICFAMLLIAVGYISYDNSVQEVQQTVDGFYVMYEDVMNDDQDVLPQIGTSNGWLEVERYEPEDAVTLDEFMRVRSGMTLSQVQQIIGFAGEPLAESELLGYQHEMWCWKNADGSNMNVQFLDGRSHTKAQLGLR